MRRHQKINIAIAGTPGTGKTTLAQRLAASDTDLKVIDLGAEAEARECRHSYDDELKSWIIDEDKLAKKLSPVLQAGDNIIDWMHADFWPLDGTINFVVLLRASNTTLYDRYKSRGYVEQKIQQNLDCEIMNDIGLELEEYYGKDEKSIVIELQNDTEEDVERNVQTIKDWIAKGRESKPLPKD